VKSKTKAHGTLLLCFLALLGSYSIGSKSSFASLLDIFFTLILFSSLPLALKNPVLRIFVFACFAWLAIQFVSDFVNQTLQLSIASLLGLQVLAYAAGMNWLYVKRGIEPLKIILAIGLGFLIQTFQSGTINYTNPWKYGFNFTASILFIFLVKLIFKSSYVDSFALIILMGVNIFFDMRHGFGLALLTLLILVIKPKKNQTLLALRVGTIIAIPLVLVSSYADFAKSGLLGERAARLQFQAEALDTNFIFQSRPEVFQTIYLVSKSPLLGYGTYGIPDGVVVQGALEFVNRYFTTLDYNSRNYLLQTSQVRVGYAAHSQIGATLIYGGLGVLLFWIPFFRTITKLFFRMLKGSDQYQGALIFVLLTLAYNIVFSPLGFLSRFQIAMVIFLASSYLIEAKKSQGTDLEEQHYGK